MQTLILPAHYLKSRKSNGVPLIKCIEDMDHKRVSMAGRFGVGCEASCEVLDGRTGRPVLFRYGGKVVKKTPWKHNLITNVGMNQIGNAGIGVGATESNNRNVIRRCIVGTGSTANHTDSGVITASQTGTTVTLSSSLGAVTEDRVIKWDSGEVAYLVSGGGTTWTASVSQEVSSDEFTVFHTNRTTLDNGIRNTTADSGSSTSSVGGGWIRQTNIYTHSAESENRNYNEVGFTWNSASTAGSNIFSRVVLPSSVSVENGQQIRVTVRLTMNVGPTTAVPSVMTVVGWDTGDITEQAININGLIDNGSGGLYSNLALSPAYGASFEMHNQSSLPSFGTSSISVISGSAGTGFLEAYAADSFFRVGGTNWSTSQGNRSGIRGIAVGGGFACLFEKAVTKANTHTLSVRFRRSWDRTYTV